MPNKKQLIVATYNIQFGINTDDIVNNIVKMAKGGTNVICIQEIINAPNQELIVDSMLQRLGKTWKAAYHMGSELSRDSIGTCILWDATILQLEREEKILLPKLRKFAPHERLYYRLINVPPTPVQRRAITCYFKFDHTTLRVTCVHVDNVGGPRHRKKQISHLLSHLNAGEETKHEIICGDFNTFDLLKTGYEKKMLQKLLGKAIIDASEHVGWTSDIYNIEFQHSIRLFPWFVKTFNVHIRSRLDYIWTKNFTVLSCEKQNLPGSDHFPIIAKLMMQ